MPREGRVALTLKTVCGFSTGEIARAFLIQEATAAQRIVRAKRLVRDLRFELPESGELAARRESVLEVLYLMFNEGYTRNAADLAEEAIRLARLVADHDTAARTGGRRAAGALPAAIGAHARAAERPGRPVPAGRPGPRAVGPRAHFRRTASAWTAAPRGDRMSQYHLEAGIAAAHATAPDFAATDWAFIVHLYDQLYAINPSPVVALNRAVAISRCARARPRGSKRWPRSSITRRWPTIICYRPPRDVCTRNSAMRRALPEFYQRALECACGPAERRFLERCYFRVGQALSPAN